MLLNLFRCSALTLKLTLYYINSIFSSFFFRFTMLAKIVVGFCWCSQLPWLHIPQHDILLIGLKQPPLFVHCRSCHQQIGRIDLLLSREGNDLTGLAWDGWHLLPQQRLAADRRRRDWIGDIRRAKEGGLLAFLLGLSALWR